MLKSYIAPAFNGNVVLRQDVLRQIGVGATCYLYGILLHEEESIILSYIPGQYWDRAYKIIIHTNHLPGSLATAATAISKLGLNTISSWASTESNNGHLSYTAIIVVEAKPVDQENFIDTIHNEIIHSLGESVSDLPTFRNNNLEPVRITPLSILAGYEKILKNKEFTTIKLNNGSLLLNNGNRKDNLWTKLLKKINAKAVSTVILTPDTEEAFARISAIEHSSKVHKLSFDISIQSNTDAFAGYWQHVLELIANEYYCVYRAHNIMIEKRTDNGHIEKAKFDFIIDKSKSEDVGSLIELKEIWTIRLHNSVQQFAKDRGDGVIIENIQLTLPRGVGIPCFFSCNAKPKDGIGSEKAIELCKILESEGFRPVNIDYAKGIPPIRTQIEKLMKACYLMVVLYCPDEQLKIADKDMYDVSDWLTFEEGLMAAQGGEIIRVGFKNIRQPEHTRGSAAWIKPEEIDKFKLMIRKWKLEWQNTEILNNNFIHEDLQQEDLLRDLVTYYGGRET